MNALEQEVKNMSSNTANECSSRMEEVIKQSNQIASSLIINERVQFYLNHPDPEYLVDDYYAEVGSRLNAHGITYIDSIMLYAPKFERVLDGASGVSYDLLQIEKIPKTVDITWLEEVEVGGRSETTILTRAKNDRWPYYITLVKYWSMGKTEGVIAVNINLRKLYDYLIANREETLQIFLVDKNEQVIVRTDKRELYKPVEEIDYLEEYRPLESLSKIHISGEKCYAYAQVYSAEYGFTCVTITTISEYLVNITRIQRKFLMIAIAAALVAMIFACVYSIKLVRPVQNIRELLDDPAQFQMGYMKYDEDIQEMANRIMSYLQTSQQLRKELDFRMDMLKDTKMLALQAQINPHFLFNTLNTVSMLAEDACGDEHPVVEMLENLSDILRYSLEEEDMVSIREEIAYIECYLSIMKYRYEDFETCIHVDENLYDYAIPRLVLQPILENAMQHGISACLSIRRGIIKLQVREMFYTYKSGRQLPSICIDVEDNGLGLDEKRLQELRDCIACHEEISKKHIGLSNVAQRFYLLFYEEQEITLESVFGQGTNVRIIFPAILPEEKMER